jgi:hypothetical protein
MLTESNGFTKLINLDFCHCFSIEETKNKDLTKIKFLNKKGDISINCIIWDSNPGFNESKTYRISEVMLKKDGNSCELIFYEFTTFIEVAKFDHEPRMDKSCENLSHGFLYSTLESFGKYRNGHIFGKILNITKKTNNQYNFSVRIEIDGNTRTFTAFKEKLLLPAFTDLLMMNKEIGSTMRFDITVKRIPDSECFYYNIQSINRCTPNHLPSSTNKITKISNNEKYAMKSSQTSYQKLPIEKISREKQTASRKQASKQPLTSKKQQTIANSQSQMNNVSLETAQPNMKKRTVKTTEISEEYFSPRDSDSYVEEEPRKKKHKS